MGWGDWTDGIGKACDEFGKNNLGPALDGIGKACHEFGEHQLGPALDGIGKACHEFGEHQLRPAMNEASKVFHHIGINQLSEEIEKAIDKLDLNQFSNNNIYMAFDHFGRYSLGDVVYNILKFLARPSDNSLVFNVLEKGLINFTQWLEEYPLDIYKYHDAYYVSFDP